MKKMIVTLSVFAVAGLLYTSSANAAATNGTSWMQYLRVEVGSGCGVTTHPGVVNIPATWRTTTNFGKSGGNTWGNTKVYWTAYGIPHYDVDGIQAKLKRAMANEFLNGINHTWYRTTTGGAWKTMSGSHYAMGYCDAYAGTCYTLPQSSYLGYCNWDFPHYGYVAAVVTRGGYGYPLSHTDYVRIQ